MSNIPYVQEKEKEVSDALVKAFNMFSSLEQTHPSDIEEFQTAIHQLQQLIAMRILRRAMPEIYPTYNKINGKWTMNNITNKEENEND